MDYVLVAKNLNEKFDFIQRLLFDDYQTFIPFTLTPRNEAVLHYVMSHPSVSPSQISNVFGITRSAVTHILNRLEKDELIERKPSHIDRRVVLIDLGTNGIQYSAAINKLSNHLALTYYTRSDEKVLEHLAFALDHLIDVITMVKAEHHELD